MEKSGARPISPLLLCSLRQGASSLSLSQDWAPGPAGKGGGRQETRSDAAGGKK